MFGIGSTEFLVILLVALLVLGPKSLSKISRTVGKYMGEFRRVSTDFQRTLNAEVAEEERKDAREAVRRKAEAARAARARREEARALASGTGAAEQEEAPAEHAGAAEAPASAPQAAPASQDAPAARAPADAGSAELPRAPEGSPLEAALRRAAEEASGTPAGPAASAGTSVPDGRDAKGGQA